MKALFKKNVVLWLAMLCGVLLDLALMGVGLLWYPSLLEAGRASTAMTCVVMLLVYGCVGIGLPIKASQAVMAALWQGTAVGRCDVRGADPRRHVTEVRQARPAPVQRLVDISCPYQERPSDHLPLT